MAAILEASMDTTRQCYPCLTPALHSPEPLIGHNEPRAAQRQDNFRALLETWRESKPTTERVITFFFCFPNIEG